MSATGKGKKKILIVAEAPGEMEDQKNTQLIGQSGQLLRKVLRKNGIDLDRDCVKTNAVICRRQDNETPDDHMIEACRPNLMKTIKQVNPNVIILLGKVAIKSLMPVIWKSDDGMVSKWGGFCIPNHDPNSWIVPTYHPSFVLRKNDSVLNILFERHIKMAVKKAKSRPYKNVPDYKNDVEIIMNPSQAAKIIIQMTIKGGPVAFDFECNCLKPDGEGPEIVSCSVCWRGKRTIAYPWRGEAIFATGQLLHSAIPKIAANLKFEDRWTRSKLKHPVRNWMWDTMIAAHVLNNQPKVTGLKFQAFALLGMPDYDEHIAPYLKSKGKSKFNRIHEIDLKDLLLYNGLDSLLTYKIAMRQMKSFYGKGKQ